MNDDDLVNINDMLGIIDYVARDVPGEEFNLLDGDCDGRAGVTMADVGAFVRTYFWGEGELDCSASGTYGFAPSNYDTVWVPRILEVPDGVSTVTLPVITVFDLDVTTFYFPVLNLGPGSNSVFELEDIIAGDDFATMSLGTLLGDSSTLIGAAISQQDELVGTKNFLSLVYTRVNAGIGDIAPELVDRNTLWQYAVQKGDGDLYRPVVRYYDVDLPADTLQVSVANLAFNAIAGLPAEETYTVNFTSSIAPIAFDLAPSETWIVITDLPPEGLVTPATVHVTASAAMLAAGEYEGQVAFVDIDPVSPTSVEQITVSFDVTSSGVIPPGDLDCSGAVDGADLSILIDALFVNPGPIAPCE